MKKLTPKRARKAFADYREIQSKIKEDISKSKIEWNAHAKKVTLLTEALRFNKQELTYTLTDKAIEIYDRELWNRSWRRLLERIRLLKIELKRETEACKTSKHLYKIYCAQQAHLYPTAKSFRAVEEGERLSKHHPPKEVTDKVLQRNAERDMVFNAMQVVVDMLEGIKKVVSEPIKLDEEIEKK